MTEKLRDLLEDVQTVYEGKGMIVHPNSFDRLRMEVIKLDNINKQQSELIEQMQDAKCISCTDLGGMLLKITDLEKENAELKAELKDANEKVVHLACNQNKDLKHKLTKAKEIIKNLLILKDDHFGNTKMEWRVEVTEQAEQFLKEIEK